MNRPDLISLLAGDLAGYRLDRPSEGFATFLPESGEGPVLEVRERVERRFLGRTRVARFGATFPAPGWSDQTLRVVHTGGLRRTGMSVGSDAEDSALVGLLESDEDFLAAAATLDFKHYEIAIRDENCVVTVELVGASLVAIAFPPIRSYVRLYPDQREALVDGFKALGRLLAVSSADRRH